MEVNPEPFRGPVSFGLEVNVGRGIVAETWLNDILLARKEAPQIAGQSLAIHHDVIQGENIAQLRIAMPGMALEQAPAPWTGPMDDGAHAQLWLQGDVVSITGDEMTVTTHRYAREVWPAEEGETPPVLMPMRIDLPFVPHCAVPGPLWASAQRLDPAVVADAVLAQTVAAGEMIRSARWDAMANATAARRAHAARCYPIGPSAQERREHEIEVLAELHAQPGFRVSIASHAEARLRVQANGRLFDWVREDGRPMILLEADGMEPSPVQLQFGVVSGQLEVLR
ncbi:MAG: hypothetical protein NTX28_15850 [Novosphingobium sp.]|nr:hypothetical protein [Novosphingobium sp.]